MCQLEDASGVSDFSDKCKEYVLASLFAPTTIFDFSFNPSINRAFPLRMTRASEE